MSLKLFLKANSSTATQSNEEASSIIVIISIVTGEHILLLTLRTKIVITAMWSKNPMNPIELSFVSVAIICGEAFNVFFLK